MQLIAKQSPSHRIQASSLLTLLALLVSAVLGTPKSFAAGKSDPVLRAECEQLLVTLPDDSFERALKGERLFGPQASADSLDATTVQNLELSDLMIEPLAKLAPTPLGKARIRYLVRHPYTDPAFIRERQAALTELLEHSAFTQESLAELKKLTDSYQAFEKTSSMTLGPNPRSMGNAITGTLMLGSVTAFGAAILGVGIHMDQKALMALGLKFMLIPGAAGLASVDTKMGVQAKSIFELYKNIAAKSPQFKSKELSRLVEVMSWPSRGDDPLGLQKMRKTYERLGANRWNVYLQMTSLTRLFIEHYGYKALKAHRKNLAIYLSAMAEFEAYLASASALSEFHGKTVLPEILDGTSGVLEIEEGQHPYHFFSGKTDSVPNSFSAVTDGRTAEASTVLHSPTAKTFFLTGPNAGGKTHYLRMVSQLMIMAQMGFPVPAKSMRITPFHPVTNFEAPDSTKDGNSRFMAQSKRLAAIAELSNKSTRPVFAALDEVLTGTSNDQHWAAELSTIKYLHGLKNLVSIVASHDRSHADLKLTGVQNIHVSLEGFEIRTGVSTDYNAFDVMDRAGVPKEITDEARRLHRERFGDKQAR